ncbi:MAG: hypothetical protein JO250_09190 [Armatimonadetes bacterium]|nr:hypothetical protein [Armatimonadota bacterium]
MSHDLRCPCGGWVIQLITDCRGTVRLVCRRCKKRLLIDLALREVKALCPQPDPDGDTSAPQDVNDQ